jgi:branched-chain amino acid transport system substrate-binding protein
MNRHLTGVMVAALAAASILPTPAFADHRPGNVVVMGGTWSLTGRFALFAGHIHKGRKLYLDELNVRGGLLGHKVKLKIFDDKSDRRTAIELYVKLITEGKVDIYLGPVSSYLTDPVANVMERYKRPFLAQATNPVIWQRGRKYVFSLPTVLSPNHQRGPLYLAKKIGVKRIAIIGEGSAFPRQVTEGALEWARKFGLKVVLLESYRKEQTDFTALLRKIHANGAEAIFSATYYRDSVAQIRQLRELDINVKLFSATIGPASPKFVKELGSTAEYVVGHSHWEPKPTLGHPGIKEFIESYENRHGEKPSYYASGGWVEMQILEAAVKHAGSFNPQEIRDALASIKVDTVRGPWKANERGVITNYDGLTFQIQKGERVIVWPPHMAEAKFLPMPKWENRAKK